MRSMWYNTICIPFGHIPLYAPTKVPHQQVLHQPAKPRQTSFETARATLSARRFWRGRKSEAGRFRTKSDCNL